jgi:hypothetical protein
MAGGIKGLSALVVLVFASGGCLGDDDSAPAPVDAATQDRLREAYTTLEVAAENVPNKRLPKSKGTVEVVEEGEDFQAPRQKNLGLVGYFGEKGISFGTSIIDDESERESALRGIQFLDDTESLFLVISRHLRHASATELLDGGAMFVALSPNGETYCLSDRGAEAQPCGP